MYFLIEKYINNLSKDNLNILALKNSISLNENELDFSYNFFKKNWNAILANPNNFVIDNYKNNYTDENFIKIKKLYYNLLSKYSHLL